MANYETLNPQEKFDLYNRAYFEQQLSEFRPFDKSRIMFAYDIAKFAHRGQARDGGERYFEHPREVTLTLLSLGIRNPDTILGSLLHDVREDTSFLGNARFLTYAELNDETRFRINSVFGSYSSAATIVIALSKPSGTDMEGRSREEIEDLYLNNLEDTRLGTSRVGVILIKMADRLHNLRTLAAVPKEKQERKIKETEEVFIPLFERTLGKSTAYASIYQSLVDQIQSAIASIKASE